MKITTVLFDLDGVLVSTKKLHYDTLNLALPAPYTITWEDHLCRYDGLKTREKLVLLTKHKGLPTDLHDEIWHLKQKLMQQHLHRLHVEPCVLGTLAALKHQGYRLGCCSKAIPLEQHPRVW